MKHTQRIPSHQPRDSDWRQRTPGRVHVVSVRPRVSRQSCTRAMDLLDLRVVRVTAHWREVSATERHRSDDSSRMSGSQVL
jgi:hypothetical protein